MVAVGDRPPMLLCSDPDLMSRCALAPWVETLLRYRDETQPHLDLPVDAPATPLEARI